MRRQEVARAVEDSLKGGTRIDADVAETFRSGDFSDIARLIQDRRDPADAAEVTSLIEWVMTDATSRELDDLADGTIRDPHGWLYNRLREML